MSPLHLEHAPFRRHYTRRELETALATAKRLLAVDNLEIVVDHDLTDQAALAMRVGREVVRLTPHVTSREMFIALSFLGNVPKMWDFDKLAKQKQAEARDTARVRRVSKTSTNTKETKT